MVTADDVRRVALALPRAYEAQVRERSKLRVGQIVFVAFDEAETRMGFGYPREAREALVAGAPETFFLPPARDLVHQWVGARLDRLEAEEMRELVIDAWRMCTPRMLHDLPEQPAPTAAAWAAMDAGDWSTVQALLHPYLHWHDRAVALRGRRQVLEHLRAHPRPRPPDEVEVRDGQVYRWRRS